jgi:hypothetical protein
VLTGQRNEHWLFKQPIDDDTVPIGRRRPDEGRVDLFVPQQVEKFEAKAFLQSQGHRRVGLTKYPNDPRHEWMKWARGCNSDADLALLASCRAPCRLKGAIELRENGSGIVEKSLSGIGQFDTTGLSAKELNIKLALDCFDALTERRLLHAQPLGSPCNVAFLGNCDDVSKVSQLH